MRDLPPFEENEMAYSALRDTILHCEDGIRTARIQMYTVYFVMLGFGFERQWLLLVTFLVLISFQAMINEGRIAVERASSYIRIFFETKRNDIHWSLLNKDEEHLSVYRLRFQNIGWHVNTVGASLLAVVSLVTLLVTNLNKYGHQLCELPASVWIEAVIAAVLCFTVFRVNGKYYTGKKRHRSTIKDIDASIEQFYEKCRMKAAEEHHSTRQPEDDGLPHETDGESSDCD